MEAPSSTTPHCAFFSKSCCHARSACLLHIFRIGNRGNTSTIERWNAPSTCVALNRSKPSGWPASGDSGSGIPRRYAVSFEVLIITLTIFFRSSAEVGHLIPSSSSDLTLRLILVFCSVLYLCGVFLVGCRLVYRPRGLAANGQFLV